MIACRTLGRREVGLAHTERHHSLAAGLHRLSQRVDLDRLARRHTLEERVEHVVGAWRRGALLCRRRPGDMSGTQFESLITTNKCSATIPYTHTYMLNRTRVEGR